jgi:hypothetical protein
VVQVKEARRRHSVVVTAVRQHKEARRRHNVVVTAGGAAQRSEKET